MSYVPAPCVPLPATITNESIIEYCKKAKTNIYFTKADLDEKIIVDTDNGQKYSINEILSLVDN